MTRNAELSKKLEKIQLELEVCKKSIRKTQTQAINTTPYSKIVFVVLNIVLAPRMASPQPFTSPTYMSPLYQQQVLPASPVIHMPPQVVRFYSNLILSLPFRECLFIRLTEPFQRILFL